MNQQIYRGPIRDMDGPKKKKFLKTKSALIFVVIVLCLAFFSRSANTILAGLLFGSTDLFVAFFSGDKTGLVVGMMLFATLVILGGLWALHKNGWLGSCWQSMSNSLGAARENAAGGVVNKWRNSITLLLVKGCESIRSWEPSKLQILSGTFAIVVTAIAVILWWYTMLNWTASIGAAVAVVFSFAIACIGMSWVVKGTLSITRSKDTSKTLRSAVTITVCAVILVCVVAGLYFLGALFGPIEHLGNLPSTEEDHATRNTIIIALTVLGVYKFFKSGKLGPLQETTEKCLLFCKENWISSLINLGIASMIVMAYLKRRSWHIELSSPSPRALWNFTSDYVIALFLAVVAAYFATYLIPDKHEKIAGRLQDNIPWLVPTLVIALAFTIVRTPAEGGKGGGKITTAPSPTAPAVAATSVVAKEVVATAGTASIATSSPEKMEKFEVPAGKGSVSEKISAKAGFKYTDFFAEKGSILTYAHDKKGDKCVVGTDCKEDMTVVFYTVVNQTEKKVPVKYRPSNE